MLTRKHFFIGLSGLFAFTWNIALAQPGSAACLADQKVVADQQAKITAFELTRNDSLYQGQGQIVYTTTLNGMRDTLAGFEASETIACSSTPYIGSGQIFPKYQVLTIIYSPPGTNGGKNASYVDYSTSGSLGSTIKASASFKTDYSINVSIKVGSGGNDAQASLGDDWTAQQTTSSEYKVTTTSKNEIKVTAPATDGIDHGYDEIWLCLNPMIQLEVVGNKITYVPGIASNPMQQIYVYVSELKNPSTMRPDVLQTLNSKGFTAADYAAILAADPFANGSTYIAPNRFIETTYTFPYEPPIQANGTPTLTSFTATNDSQSTMGTENSASNTLTVSASVSAGFSLIEDATVSTKDSWTWSQTNSSETITGATSSAAVNVTGPAYGYAGSIAQVAVYWDTIFNSFLFAPVAISNPFVTGILYGKNHIPLPGQKVVLTTSGHTFQTYSNNKGAYSFVGLSPAVETAGTLSAGGSTQTISIGPARLAHDITIPDR